MFYDNKQRYLSKNGDMLYYSESGESTYSLSVGVAYEIGSVSLGIPLGKASVYSKSYETVRIKPTLIKQ